MRHPSLARRAFLGQSSAGAAVLLGGPRLLAADDKELRLIERVKDPLNLEMPLEALDQTLTPTRLFYVRNHYPTPKIDARTWKLEVTGAVKKPLSLTYDALRKMRSVTMPITLECAGNGRSFLQPKQKGVQWGAGGVGTAEWTGVPLAEVLDLAGVRPGAVEVILDGADKGDPKKEIQPPGHISFARSLSLEKARKPEVLLVWAMNKADLTPDHGYPVRAIVGGWYGMASVKWLTRVIVTTRPFLGFDQTIDYGYWEKDEHGLDQLVPITQMQPKALIGRPKAGDVLAANVETRVTGAAWAGESEVARVEVSTDEGKTWSAAKLLGDARPFSWRLWEWAWKPQAGRAVLMVRATDKRGRTQPMRHDPARRNYMINFVLPTAVVVK